MILADPMLWRLVWKEYRAQRGFWLAIAGAGVGLMFLLTWLLEARDGRFTAPWTIAVVLPGFFALGSAAMAFAAEKEEGTADLLRIMAARASRVYAGKISFSLVGTLAMWASLLTVARLVTWGNVLPSIDNEHSHFPQLLFVIAITAQISAWGFVFSLVCRKVLTAVCLTAVVALLSMLSIAYVQKMSEHDFANAYFQLLPVLPLLAVAYLLTARLFAGRSLDLSLPRHLRTGSPIASWAAVAEFGRLAAVRETAPVWQRQLKRLVWLEFRQALSLGLVLWIVGLLFFAWLPFETNNVGLDAARGLIGVLLSSLMLGVWTFHAEGGKRTRFLADHGLSPQIAWLTRQFVWGLLLVAVTAPCVLAVGIANQNLIERFQHAHSSVFHSDVPGASAVVFSATLAGLGFAVGQFASMLIPRAISAAFVGFVIMALVGPWTWLVVELRVPLAISAVPVFAILMAATFAWSRHWLLEQATLRSWVRLVLALAASAFAVWGAIGTFRVFEVPRPGFLDGFAMLRNAQGRPIDSHEAETANLYCQALALLNWDSKSQGAYTRITRQVPSADWAPITEEERRSIADNQEALRLCLVATERPTCAFNDPLCGLSELKRSLSSPLEFARLATLILLSARALETDGKLDEALDRYVAVLRLARHVASRGAITHWSEAMLLETMAAARIPEWAVHPEQTAERIESGAKRISQEAAQMPPLRDALLTQQFMIRRLLIDDWSEAVSNNNPSLDAQARTAIKVIDRCCPWEHARMLRVLDLVDASQLHHLNLLEQALATPGRDVQQLEGVATVPDPSRVAINRQSQGSTGHRSGPDEFFSQNQPDGRGEEPIPWNWVHTTFPLNTLIPNNFFSHIAQTRLRRELSLRIMVLQLKLAAFKKAHGQYPDQIWPGFGMDAVDPYTGAEFGFRPLGYRVPVRVVDGLTNVVERVDAGRPIVWSRGPSNVRLFSAMVAEDGEEDEKAKLSLSPANSPLAFPLP